MLFLFTSFAKFIFWSFDSIVLFVHPVGFRKLRLVRLARSIWSLSLAKYMLTYFEILGVFINCFLLGRCLRGYGGVWGWRGGSGATGSWLWLVTNWNLGRLDGGSGLWLGSWWGWGGWWGGLLGEDDDQEDGNDSDMLKSPHVWL